ncbi:MFS transporter [Micromonospora sp. NPDC005215]|uniref:MFS transporter n=1 Tax=Micromonospora sp. NPDC005215 TaxID=3157024 RepID=UPI0033AF8873
MSLASFMTSLDMTIINIAMPSVVRDLDASLTTVAWVANAYLIVVAVLVIVTGRLGDLYGPRRLFVMGSVLFTLASAACGLAQSEGQLIAARAFQGLGAALMYPQSMSIIVATFPPQRRGGALGLWTAVSALASILGPVIGGALTSILSWRYVFFLNLPVGLIMIVLCLAAVPPLERGRRQPLHLLAVVLSTAALVCLTFGLVEGDRFEWGVIWGPLSIPLLLVLSVVLAAAFVVLQKRRQDRTPLVPFELFALTNFRLMIIVTTILSIGIVGTSVPLSLYVQAALGYSPIKVGLVMTPMFLSMAFVAPFAGKLSDRLSARYVLMTGLSLYAVGMALVVWVANDATPWQHFVPGLVVAGVGAGCTFAPMNSIAMHDVQPPQAGAAAALMMTARQLASVFAAAVPIALLQGQLVRRMPEDATALAPALPAGVGEPFVAAFRQVSAAGPDETVGEVVDAVRRSGASPEAVDAAGRAAHAVYTHSFVTALRPTLLVPIALLLVGVVFAARVVPTGRRASATPDAVDRSGAADEADALPRPVS